MFELALSRRKAWDVIVVGGGATGLGCALDAASRGLDVLLLEQADFGKGTSGRSTKLIHGGVRYLAQGNISLVREALSERCILLHIAPDFIQKQSFLVPCYSRFSQLYYGAGLKIYDLLAGDRSFGRTVLRGAEATLRSLPGLRPEGLRGSVAYSDGRFDDTRFLIGLAAASAERGAVLINYAEVESIDLSEGRGVNEVGFRDLESGERYLTQARAVILAAGIFTPQSADSGEPPPGDGKLAFSQGIHIVLDREFLGGDDALMIPKTSDGRVLFAIPWHGKLLAGTTDTPVAEPSLEPKALDSEIDFVLENCSGYFARKPGKDDIRSVFAGIRPLVASPGERETSRLSREHSIVTDEDGLVKITGGKWTTYRLMAAEAVDEAVRVGGLKARMSETDRLPIRDRRMKGTAKLMSEDNSLAKKLSPEFEYTFADAVYAVKSEMARTIDDVLSRRTRILYTDAREAVRLAPVIADLLQKEIGWTDEEKQRELSDFTDLSANYLPDGSL